MMFPIKAKEILPVDKIVVRSISVRGGMGPMTVWVSNQDEIPDTNRQYNFPLNSDSWTEVYRKFHPPSYQKYVKLDLMENPICLRPGQIRAIYVHSSLSGDEAIVYDNSNGASRTRYQDSFIHISKGKAHLSPKPFGQSPIWGWGKSTYLQFVLFKQTHHNLIPFSHIFLQVMLGVTTVNLLVK